MGYLHRSSFLEEITTRLGDVLAEVLEQHTAEIFGGLLALLKLTLLPLTVVVGYVASSQLPGKSPEMRVTHSMMESLVPARLREFDEKRECSRELLRLGSTPIEILEVDTGSTISDVRKDNRFEYMSHLTTIVVESRNTTLLVITHHLADPSLLLGGGETFLQIVVSGLLG